MNIILASNSPRRTEILTLANIPHIIIPSKVEEKIDNCLTPNELAKSLAHQKAIDVFSNYSDSIIIGADTIVVIDNIILGKPKDRKDAIRMLTLLSGKTHEVITGVSIISKEYQSNFAVTSKVTFNEMSLQEIEEYIDSENVYDKAGSYAIQGSCCKHINKIDGDYYNIMGLPISNIYQELKNHQLS